MPLLHYFGWVGSVLLAWLLAANWLFSGTPAVPPGPEASLGPKITIRIRSDHKWPEKVVFDTTGSFMAAAANVGPETGVSPDRNFAATERQRALEAFAEMPPEAAEGCPEQPCSAGQDSEMLVQPIGQAIGQAIGKGRPQRNRQHAVAAHPGLIGPNHLRRRTGRS
jgi:hypothetical protein